MANTKFEASELLGKHVILTHRDSGFDFEHRGTVIAVITVLPGSRATASIMLEESATRCDYFDWDEITIQAVL